eukprot:11089824-Alexandrium_andersonii.AAC.1
MGAECPGGPLGHPQARGFARSRNQSSERAKAEGCPEGGDWTHHSPGGWGPARLPSQARCPARPA